MKTKNMLKVQQDDVLECQNFFKKPRKTDKGKSKEQIFEEAIHRMKALEARKKRAKLEGESVEYVTPPKNNGLVKEKKKLSFIIKVLSILKSLKP